MIPPAPTCDGLPIEPLCAARRDASPLAGRGGQAWAVMDVIDAPDPDAANCQALDAIAGGAGLALRLSGGWLAGGGSAAGGDALRILLEGVDLAATVIVVDAHPDGPFVAGWLAAHADRQGVAPALTRIDFGLDPIAVLASGAAPFDDGRAYLAACAALRAAGYSERLVGLDGRAFHAAGASAAQELAAMLGAALWWLRAFEAAGLDAGTAASAFSARVSVDQDQFVSIAKLRALRLLWARLLEVLGQPHRRLRLHAETSPRMMDPAQPRMNLPRTAIAAFAAAAGGADSLAVLPFDAAPGPSTREGRTLARNIQHLLIAEVQAHRVADAAAGSGTFEALTEALAAAAWTELQGIESEGGIADSLASGALQARIASEREARSNGLQETERP